MIARADAWLMPIDSWLVVLSAGWLIFKAAFWLTRKL